jgi:hypothetical protein
MERERWYLVFYQVHDLGGHPSDHERIQGSVGTLPYHQRHLTRDSIVMNRDSIVRNRDSIVRNRDSVVKLRRYSLPYHQ